MNRFFKTLILISIFYLLLSFSLPILAEVDPAASCLKNCEPGGILKDTSPPMPGWKNCICCGDCQLIDFLRIARMIIQALMSLAGVWALIYGIVGGIMMMLSGGKQEKVLQGKRMIGFSLIGLIIVFLAWQIVNLVVCGITQGRLEQSCFIFGRAWNVFPQ